MMRTKLVISIVMILLIISNILDWFYPAVENSFSSRLLPQFFLVLGFFVAFIFYFFFLTKKRILNRAFPISLILWILLQTIYAIFYNKDLTGAETLMILAKMIIWPMYGLVFFLIAYNSELDYQDLFKWIVIFAVMTCLRSIYLLYINGFQLVSQTNATREIANQNSYILLWCLPFIWIEKDSGIKIKSLLLLLFSTFVLSMKRGPILAIIIAFFITELGYSNISLRKKIITGIVFFLLISILCLTIS
jgi:hypothetical protein